MWQARLLAGDTRTLPYVVLGEWNPHFAKIATTMLFRVCACVILCFVWLLNVFIVFESQFSIRNLLITQLNKLSDYLTIK